MSPWSRWFGLLGLSVVAAGSDGQIVSETRWTNGSGGAFADASNWDAGVPDATTLARFGVDSFYDVELESDAAVAELSIDAGQILLFGGHRLDVERRAINFADELTISDAGTGLRAGEWVSGDSTVTHVRRGAMLQTNTARFEGFTSITDNNSAITVEQSSFVDGGLVGVRSGGSFTVGVGTDGFLSVQPVVGFFDSNQSSRLLVIGDGSSVTVGDRIFVGTNDRARGFMDVLDGGFVTARAIETRGSFSGSIFSAAPGVRVSGPGSSVVVADELDVVATGAETFGNRVSINDGATLTAGSARITSTAGFGRESQVTISSGGLLDVDDRLDVGGDGGQGSVSVTTAGILQSGSAVIDADTEEVARVRVDGVGSRWRNAGELRLSGEAELIVTDRGDVSTHQFRSATVGGVNAFQTRVAGPGSVLNVETDSTLGGDGESTTMSVGDGAIFATGGRLTVGANASLHVDDGTVAFGESTVADLRRVSGDAGALLGQINLVGDTTVAELRADSVAALDLDGVEVNNRGLISGDGRTPLGIRNHAGGEVRVRGSEWAAFGADSTNAGDVFNFGGQLEFGSGLTNHADGRIAGRGQFIVGESLENLGVMQFSGGLADVLGDVDNVGDGVILTSGGGVTTFFDDLHHSGGEIRTAAGATTVVFGDYSGDGALTGGGDVRLEGGVALGNSPAVVSFGGDLFLGVDSFTEIELAGTGIGEFDRFEVAGDFTIGGRLTTALIDGFKLSAGQSFEIAEAGGTLFGRFDGLADGDRVATFGGHSLLIDYGTSHIRLFAVAVPEPGGAALMIVAGFAATRRRRLR